jgi:hypothetical protein
MNPPDFFVAGAPRCGTTSLFNYLQQHPRIQMSRRKEPAYFHFTYPRPDFAEMAANNGSGHLSESRSHYERTRASSVTDPAEYSDLWSDKPGVQIRGEATPTYLYDARAIESISRVNPAAKLILLLRNPVDRAYSQYLQYLRHGYETLYDFEAALAKEPIDIETFWWGQRRYVRMGLYADHIERCLRLFTRANVGTFLHDDLVVDPGRTVGEIVAFLGLTEPLHFDTSAQYESAFVPVPSLAVRMVRGEGVLKTAARTLLPDRVRNRLYRRILYRRPAAPPPLLPSTRSRLLRFYLHDIHRLEDLIQRSLSNWTD